MFSYDAVIIHGSFGDPFGNWAPWLYSQLTERNKKVLVPHLPTPEAQNLVNWERILGSYSDFISEDTSIIAHSLAPAFVIDFLLNRAKKVDTALFVSPFYDLIDIKEFDDVNRTFFVSGMDISRFTNNAKKRICVYSDDDPYVPIKMSDDFCKKIGAEKHIVPGGQHLNKSSGFSEFPLLLELLNI